MKQIDRAIKFDTEKDYVNAALYYQHSINEEGVADAYIDLALLYFQFTDFGMNAGSSLPLEFIKGSFDKYEIVIDEGIRKFPTNAEMKFWKKYFRHRDIYDDLTEDEVLRILDDGDVTLVPYFYLYMLNQEKYEDKKLELLNLCRQSDTSKNRWILSLIEE